MIRVEGWGTVSWDSTEEATGLADIATLFGMLSPQRQTVIQDFTSKTHNPSVGHAGRGHVLHLVVSLESPLSQSGASASYANDDWGYYDNNDTELGHDDQPLTHAQLGDFERLLKGLKGECIRLEIDDPRSISVRIDSVPSVPDLETIAQLLTA